MIYSIEVSDIQSRDFDINVYIYIYVVWLIVSNKRKYTVLPKQVPVKPGTQPHSKVKELPALPVREHQQDNMLQQQQNVLQDEVVYVVSHQQHQQQQ